MYFRVALTLLTLLPAAQILRSVIGVLSQRLLILSRQGAKRMSFQMFAL